MHSFSEIIQRARMQKGKPRIALVAADDERILRLLPVIETLARPVLIGKKQTVAELIDGIGKLQGNYEIIDAKDPRKAIRVALDVMHHENGGILLQASRDGELFTREVFRKEMGLHASPILSHSSLIEDAPGNRCFMITDTLVHPHPTLRQKIAILNNACSLAKALGTSKPKIAALAALEYVNPSIPSTMDAAVLSKMAQRHQFEDAIVEGPLDIDCAVSTDACKRKKVSSAVTGDVDIYLVSDCESGYCFSQFLSLFGMMKMGGIVLGYPFPVVPIMPYLVPDGIIGGIAAACLFCMETRHV
jgi:phosphate butyryltransferase